MRKPRTARLREALVITEKTEGMFLGMICKAQSHERRGLGMIEMIETLKKRFLEKKKKK